MMCKWSKADNQMMSPHMARHAGMALFVQPMYGDGIYYRVIIQHNYWTMTLRKRYNDIESAQLACEFWAGCMVDCGRGK